MKIIMVLPHTNQKKRPFPPSHMWRERGYNCQFARTNTKGKKGKIWEIEGKTPAAKFALLIQKPNIRGTDGGGEIDTFPEIKRRENAKKGRKITLKSKVFFSLASGGIWGMENRIGELHFLTLNPGLKKKKKKRRRRGIIGGEEGERTLH